MQKALYTIAVAKFGVDDDQHISARHIDGANFEGGQYILTGNSPRTIPLSKIWNLLGVI
jgi:hypothetical protein